MPVRKDRYLSKPFDKIWIAGKIFTYIFSNDASELKIKFKMVIIQKIGSFTKKKEVVFLNRK